ncbi:Protein phosphatase 1 regulatory subunit 37 homolog [Caenorhabditis elegans]|uniref:Isoform b of Protein phosphatase 1 regulatory subunit 37 homolog n=1 Tax=Caenorhabditis elegans TaxID=6239 RepID=Q19857-2|nr:Protein phosphatase 1 regulatory subunit 37 homolog [Caenorhabditis elegans]CAD54134.1 Protein phosphatase 1 regulatory subunit 37 homolog [Caenorhabditis elegans]|eukprot:NP_872197.1 Protein phosphatase 1 regulatory subunit 37 homolog [Caenorhabditis elegans]
MSMKFLTGLQDLLGLYETGTAASSPASPIPPTSPAMFAVPPQQQSHSAATSVRKKTCQDANSSGEDPNGRIRQCSHARTVSFPADMDLITGYHEAPSSLFHSYHDSQRVIDSSEILTAYREACQRRQCAPSAAVEKQIGYFHKSPDTRQELLSLKGERVSHAQMEALEEIFKRVQFNTIDFEYTFLDDDCAISLGEMIEFYDSCVRLNLSFNKQIDMRGWTTIFRSIRHAVSLQMLNLRYTNLNDRSIPALCKMARAQPSASLTCLHLENTQMSGKNLLVLICALKNNTGLRELYLGDNGLQPTDGSHIYQLITSNSSLQLLDLRNNSIGDSGVRHICDGLRHREAVEKSSLSAMVLWNNNVTGASMDSLAEALIENTKIETLNIGNNNLGVEGIARLKPALASNSHLHRLGLQNTGINCEGAIILAECIADNIALLRVDIRDNPIALAGLLALHSAMKMNTSITLLNIDASCVKLSSEKDEFERYFREIQTYCDRNKDDVLKRLTVTFDDEEGDSGVEKKDGNECEGEDNKDRQDTPAETENGVSSNESKLENEEVGVSKPESNNNEKSPLMASSSTSKLSRKERHQRFVRSSSLTCTETVHDIHDRLREMSGSTHSLDAAIAAAASNSTMQNLLTVSYGSNPGPLDSSSNSESMKTIKKSFTVTAASSSSLPLAEWGSLPALPQASPSSTPVVRKLRRFSVSPSSSVFDVATTSSAASSTASSPIPENSIALPVRPSTLAIGIPIIGSVPAGPSSAPLILVEDHKDGPITSNQISDTERRISEEIERQKKDEQEIEKSCRSVIRDLLNYVEYEEKSQVERKASLLLRNTFSRPNPEELLRNLRLSEATGSTTPRTPLTPSRYVQVFNINSFLKLYFIKACILRVLEIAEELEGESDEQICQSVIRCLVRDVLQAEKNELRSTLDRRRRHNSVRNSPV